MVAVSPLMVMIVVCLKRREKREERERERERLILIPFLCSACLSLVPHPCCPVPFFFLWFSLSRTLELWHAVSSPLCVHRTIDVSLADSTKRLHTLHLRLPVDYPLSPPHCECDLPSVFVPTWHSGSGLVNVVQQFRTVSVRIV
jgi:FANCL UBC-like domain 2